MYFYDDYYYDDGDGSSGIASAHNLTEKQILEKLYRYTGGADWYSNEGWFEKESFCEWEG